MHILTNRREPEIEIEVKKLVEKSQGPALELLNLAW